MKKNDLKWHENIDDVGEDPFYTADLMIGDVLAIEIIVSKESRRWGACINAGGGGHTIYEFEGEKSAQAAARRAAEQARHIALELVASTDKLLNPLALFGKFEVVPDPRRNEKLKTCQAASDGECVHPNCPQRRDGEPKKSGRSCPLPTGDDDDAPRLRRVK